MPVYARAYQRALSRKEIMTPTSQVPTRWGYPISAIDPFDEAVFASQPIAIQQALSWKAGSPAIVPMSLTTAMKLAAQGYFVDLPMMVWGWDPLPLMEERLTPPNDGYYRDATGLMPPRMASTNIADYPPALPPAPPAPAFTSAVGIASNAPYVNPNSPYNGMAMFNITPLASSVNPGVKYEDPLGRGEFVKIVQQGPFGATIFFVELPLGFVMP